MDYPGVGPEHSYLKDLGRAEYFSVTDEEALEGKLDKFGQDDHLNFRCMLLCLCVLVCHFCCLLSKALSSSGQPIFRYPKKSRGSKKLGSCDFELQFILLILLSCCLITLKEDVVEGRDFDF